ncbi:GH92 family glycosyl hydrolase [Viscerimonas tarda]
MVKKNLVKLFLLALILSSCSTTEEKSLTDYVNPFIGTGGHGHTYPGAVVPHGLVQLSPDTRFAGWDACGGYYHDDAALRGFSHTHLSGTGIGDYGDFLFLPITGTPVEIAPNGEDKTGGFGSKFSHEQEVASPGYYKVLLQDYNVLAELTASKHAGYHQYTYPESDKAGVYIDLTTSVQERRVVHAELKVLSDTEISGMRQVKGWATNRYAYFYAKFSKPFNYEIEADGERVVLKDEAEATASKLKAFINFKENTQKDEKVTVRVGISFVDADGAKNNAEKELANRSFDEVRQDAAKVWNEELAKIKVKSSDETSKTIFYTALYHAMLEPTVSSDVDGRYRTMDHQIAQSDDYTNYSVFSLWDTFRALHPLYTIITPDDNQAMIRSLLTKYDEGGILPMWELASNYTGCMIGYHAVSVIVDSYMKGERNFDVEKAFAAAKHSSSYDTLNLTSHIDRHILNNNLAPIGKYYKNTLGYIPSDKENESVAKALEYAYNDWLIAQFAKDLGKTEDYEKFTTLSNNYKQYFDKSTGFMRGIMSDGTWKTPFSPAHSDHRHDDYCEGNAWQWTWFVPQDVQGLVELMGGREQFIAKLDSLFSVSSELEGENISADISGLIGQYAHGNEPSHQTIHLYNQVGQPWRTQELVDEVLYTLYHNDPNGLSGNEDCGQMSAWYVLNSMGFYSYCPGIPAYSIGRPVFDEVDIQLKDNKVFSVKVLNNSKENKYVKSAKLNGKLLDKPFFTHAELVNGGVLEIEMSAQANKEWAAK